MRLSSRLPSSLLLLIILPSFVHPMALCAAIKCPGVQDASAPVATPGCSHCSSAPAQHCDSQPTPQPAPAPPPHCFLLATPERFLTRPPESISAPELTLLT